MLFYRISINFKRLIFDLTKRAGAQVAWTTSDLEACYDRELTNIGSIVEEFIGLIREAINLVIKLLPRCKHFIIALIAMSLLFWKNEWLFQIMLK